MRKQYYFRPSGRGLLAWDVERLIALAKDLPVRQVALKQIREFDEPFTPAFDKPPTWRSIAEHLQLIQEADLRFPIILAADGRVMDGMHRAAKALLSGQASIRAVQFSRDPEPQYIGRQPDDLPYV